jgi:hypothetical protein
VNTAVVSSESSQAAPPTATPNQAAPLSAAQHHPSHSIPPHDAAGFRPGQLNAAAAWKIGRKGAECADCHRLFQNGNLVFSSLSIDGATHTEQPVFLRVDRCGVCYQKNGKQSSGGILWRTQHEESPRKPKLDLVSLGEVFRQLAASNDARLRDLKFLVALLLLRHRRLRVVRTYTQHDRDFISVAFGRSRDTIELEASDLTKEQMDGLRSQLLAIFAGGDLAAAGISPANDAPVPSQELPAEAVSQVEPAVTTHGMNPVGAAPMPADGDMPPPAPVPYKGAA